MSVMCRPVLETAVDSNGQPHYQSMKTSKKDVMAYIIAELKGRRMRAAQ